MTSSGRVSAFTLHVQQDLLVNKSDYLIGNRQGQMGMDGAAQHLQSGPWSTGRIFLAAQVSMDVTAV